MKPARSAIAPPSSPSIDPPAPPSSTPPPTLAGVPSTPSPAIASMVDVQLEDPAFINATGKELAHNPTQDFVVVEWKDGNGQPQKAEAAFDAQGHAQVAVSLPSVTTSQVHIQRRGPHAAPIEWSTVSPVTPTALKTTQQASLMGRARISAWVDPRMFMKGKDDPSFSDAALKDVPTTDRGIVDDFTLLNLVTLEGDSSAVKATLRYPSDWHRQVINLCHARGIQVLLGVGSMPQKDDNAALKTFLDQATVDVSKLGEQLAKIAIGNGYDGVDFDFEEISTRWSANLQKNLRALYVDLADRLAKDNRWLGIACGVLVGHKDLENEKHRLMSDTGLPATGSIEGQPYDLARDHSNIVMRVMGYDTGKSSLSAIQKHYEAVLDFALRDPSQDGCGLHPSQIQMGIKIFRPEGGKGGEITWRPNMFDTCFKILRPRRVGLIEFAFGLGVQKSAFWDENLVKANLSLNGEQPSAADWKQVTSAIAGATVGRPLHVPLDPVALARLTTPLPPTES